MSYDAGIGRIHCLSSRMHEQRFPSGKSIYEVFPVGETASMQHAPATLAEGKLSPEHV